MRMYCLECLNEWSSNGADRSSYQCPKCGAYDVMEVVLRKNIREKKTTDMEAGQINQPRRED